MRFFLRPFFLYLIALWIFSHLFPWVIFRTDTALLATAFVLLILNTVGKPILKVILLPINIITLGLFSWGIHVVIVFLSTLIVPQFVLKPAHFPGLAVGKLVWPPIDLNIIWTYLVFALLLSTLINLISWFLTVEE